MLFEKTSVTLACKGSNVQTLTPPRSDCLTYITHKYLSIQDGTAHEKPFPRLGPGCEARSSVILNTDSTKGF